MQTLVLLALVGLGAQLVDGALGMAYGVTSTTLLLAIGANPAAASASVHLAEIGTTLASGVSHWRFGNVDWKVVLRIGVPGAIGAFLGATVLSALSTDVAKPVMSVILLALGLYILTRFTFRSLPRVDRAKPLRLRFLAPVGLVGGFLDATGGGGWGPVGTPALLASGRIEPRKVIGSIDTSEFLVAIAASIGFLIGLGSGGFDLTWVGALLAGGLIAAPIAAWLVRKLPARLLGSLVGGIIIFTNARTLLLQWDAEGAVTGWVLAAVAVVWAAAVAVSWRAWRAEKHASHTAPHAAPDTATATATPTTPDAAPDTATATAAPTAPADADASGELVGNAAKD
ncbi:sulfite exporter TauE/SafE family protein [Microbacterium aureliae]